MIDRFVEMGNMSILATPCRRHWSASARDIDVSQA